MQTCAPTPIAVHLKRADACMQRGAVPGPLSPPCKRGSPACGAMMRWLRAVLDSMHMPSGPYRAVARGAAA